MKKNENEAAPDSITRPASASFIPELADFVRNIAAECCYSDNTIKELGLAIEEAAGNIIRFACRDGSGEIEIACGVHDSGALFITVIDTGAPFNMLLAGTFPEADDFFESGEKPSTKVMKKAARNIEYKRHSDKNILVLTVSHDPGGLRR